MESHTFRTNSMSERDSSATALRAVAGDSPPTRPEGTRRKLLVVDALEIEAPRRRCRAGFAARTAFQQRRNLLGRQFDHRPDERPHHVAQEAVGGDLELERL